MDIYILKFIIICWTLAIYSVIVTSFELSLSDFGGNLIFHCLSASYASAAHNSLAIAKLAACGSTAHGKSAAYRGRSL